jgi:hypothetical protein
MPEYHILNLGAGIQSTAVYLLSMEGKLPKFDAAIFADTKAEPEAVYAHLKWLQLQKGAPIFIRSKGSLAAHLQKGINSTGGRFASIPAFTSPVEGETKNLGRVRRQCTKEYKIEVIDRCIRREILGLKPRQRIPKDVRIIQYYGISWDERGRATRIYERSLEHKWLTVNFPLIETMKPPMTRWNCESYLEPRVPHQVVKSACVFCPFRQDDEWRKLKKNPKDWNRAVQVDEALRIPGNVVNRKLDQKLYLHPSALPLVQIDFTDKQENLGFQNECDGVCGV